MKTLVATPDPDWENLSKKLADELTDTQLVIAEICDEIKQLLLAKNRKYGNSALEPIRIFSKANSREQLAIRVDDKLNRKLNMQSDEDEDIDLDLIGYLILLRVHDRIKLRNNL